MIRKEEGKRTGSVRIEMIQSIYIYVDVYFAWTVKREGAGEASCQEQCTHFISVTNSAALTWIGWSGIS